MAGYTRSFGAVSDDIWALKLDAAGEIAWQKSLGGSSVDRALGVTQTLDGGYVLGGERVGPMPKGVV